MKKMLSVLLIGLLMVSGLIFPAMAEGAVTVIVNGEKLISDVPAQPFPVYNEQGGYIGDRVLLPLRAIGEKLNCDVYWNEETEGITLYRNNNLYIMWVDKDTAFHLGGIALSDGYTMDVPPVVINDRTLIPVRAVAEILGAEVNWIEQTNTVDIKYQLGELENNAGIAEQCSIYERLLLQQYDDYKGLLNGTIEAVTGSIILTNGDTMKFELYPQMAPETCEQFISLAKAGFYDNTVFHRVIEGFVAQGGGFDVNGELKRAQNISGEFVMNGFFNLIPHRRGTLSFARATDHNSATNQFFIVHQDTPNLDGNYAGFGRITEGLEIVDKICATETDENDKPVNPIVVKQIVID